MRVYQTIDPPEPYLPDLIVGIGNFDGVHLGHLQIINSIKQKAGSRGTPGIITFTRNTRGVLKGNCQAPLTTLSQKLDIFRREGIKICWLIDFSREFSQQNPRSFVRKILCQTLGIQGLCLGQGYRFGRDRSGDIKLLRKMSDDLGFWVEEIPAVKIGGVRVSSSLIRKLIGRGEVRRAAQALGHDYCLTGTVIRGAELGHQWGYPTANFYPEQLVPAAGVYAARILIQTGSYDGMVYIGRRPTLSGGSFSPLVAEAHLFDWQGKLYRRRLKVFLKKKVRGDINFKSLELLFHQIKRDEEKARRWLTE